MTRISNLATLLAVVVALCASRASLAQTTKTELRTVTVLGIHGNTVILMNQAGETTEYTVVPTQKFTMHGKKITLADVKPGMKLTAVVETTKKPVSVTKTEIRGGKLIAIAGSTIVVQEKGEYKSYKIPRGFRFLVNGQDTAVQDLRVGMTLNATIVSMETKMVTEQELKTVYAKAVPAPAPPQPPTPKAAKPPPPPPPTAAPPPPAAPAPAPAPTAAKAAPPRTPLATPKAAPPTTQSSPGGPLTAVDRILQEMTLGNIAFNAPESINIRDTAQITLLLSIEKSIPELQSAISDAGQKEGAQVRVTGKMEARLTGANFQITANTPEEQGIASKGMTEWKWQIRPLAVGRHHLHLTLNAVIVVDGSPTRRTITTFDKTIAVDITAPQLIAGFVTTNWQWLWAVVLSPIAVWLWKRSRKKGRRRRGED